MFLNTLKPAKGSKKDAVRVGRGIGSGLGKTCGRGHKGQRARAGGFHKVGFEGGQMPLQRRLPKFGFTSRKNLVKQPVRLSDLAGLETDRITLETLKAAGVIRKSTKFVKIYLSGEISQTLHISGISISKGARALVEKLGGKVEE